MRWIVGLLLVSAATLKAVQLIIEPTAVLATGRLLPPLQVGAELAVGLLALNGTYWRQLRWIALLLFIGFAAYSLHLATSGATSCGCFGPLRVHPWWTFGLDLAVVSGLLISIVDSKSVPLLAANRSVPISDEHKTTISERQPEERKQCGREVEQPVRYHRILEAAAMVISVITTAILFRHINDRTATADGMLQMASGLIVLEPDKWVGKPLPIADFIDFTPGSQLSAPRSMLPASDVPDPLVSSTDLMRGNWTVLLHRHDCPACQEAVPKYEQLALAGTRVALVEVPPYGDSHHRETACHYARLSDDREWFVQTPVEIKLRDGVVVNISHHQGER